jgi:hypothetical protein
MIIVIPRYTKLKYYARAAHLQALEELKGRILPCFKYVPPRPSRMSGT